MRLTCKVKLEFQEEKGVITLSNLKPEVRSRRRSLNVEWQQLRYMERHTLLCLTLLHRPYLRTRNAQDGFTSLANIYLLINIRISCQW